MDLATFPLSELTVSYWRTALRLAHFTGLVLGFGGAVFIDLLLHRFLRRDLTRDAYETVVHSSRYVSVGLALLWLSGLGFLALYALAEPAKLSNPKILAKVTIVAVLTLNGCFVHRRVIPFLRGQIGQPLAAGMAANARGSMAACAAISGVSWAVPVVLGAAPQLNFTTPYWVIMAAYIGLLIFALAAILLLSAPTGALSAETAPLRRRILR